MNILLIGNGGREHAIAWKLAQSSRIEQIFIAPGNAGTALEDKCINIDINVDEIDNLIDFAKTNQITLTIVGPELPLSLGIVDQFTAHDLACFGPTQAASQLETSKAFCKAFAEKYQIPTAKAQTFTELESALAYAKQHDYPMVVKADGLAQGKGVVIAQNFDEARDAINDMLAHNKFGNAGQKVIIEQFLKGEEASYFVIADGKNFLTLSSAQDHKARDNQDKGPNTGGMGAYSPAPLVDDALETKIIEQIIKPTLAGMAKENLPYQGFLFAGVMVVDNQPYLLEYNCRLGDPETQVLMPRLKTDLLALIQAATQQQLSEQKVEWDPQTALTVVMCAKGYPFAYAKNDHIAGLNDINSKHGYKVFFAGAKMQDDKILTNGGRVLAVTCLAKNVAIAQQNAYHIVKQINWPGVFYRTDIGYKAISSMI